MPELGKIKHQIKTMLELQDELNAKIHPDWRSQNYPWYRAIWTECAELMDHCSWKWWKSQERNMDQVKLELVDIWHFILSNELSAHTKLADKSSEEIASRMAFFYKVMFPPTVSEKKFFSERPDSFIEIVELMVSDSIQRNVRPARFFEAMKAIGMDMGELFNMYVGKFVLNKFRQDNGYNTGEYRKTWDGKEDNEHLSEIIKQVSGEEADIIEKIYRNLEDRYELSLIANAERLLAGISMCNKRL